MKYSATFLFLMLCFLFAKAQPKAKIGMTINEVKSIYPKASLVQNEMNSVIMNKGNVYNLENDWGFRFKNDTLDWIYFHHHMFELNKENFEKCLYAAKKLIADYEEAYGAADLIEIGDTTYKDPYVERHWGYDVIEARWKNVENMKVKIEFSFFGGKGEYFMLFEVHFFDKDYPYYD